MLSTIKTAAILAMAALSIFLAVQLWLVHIPNRSFFPYMQARFMAAPPPDEVAEFVRPFRIITGTGNGFFNISYSGVETARFWEAGLETLNAIMHMGRFSSQTEIGFSYIDSYPVIIFDYAFPMDATIYGQFFGPRAGTFLTAVGLQNFRKVIIRPEIDDFSVTFVCDKYSWEFVMPNLMPAVLQELDIPEPDHRRFVFNTATGGFYPRFDISFVYHPIIVTNPYQNSAGLLHLSFIGGRVEHFFNNPATINQGLSGGVYTFGNVNTVVRYLPLDVIEYTSFRTIGRAPTSFVADFSAAHSFVIADPNMRNEFFLARYERRGRENVFWFDYVVGNFPLILVDSWYTDDGCTDPLRHPIEVVVDQGRVVRYRKIAYNFSVDSSTNVWLALPAEAVRAGFPIRSNLSTAQHLTLQCLEHTP